MADIAKLITQLDEALRDESTASDLRRVARILIGDPMVQTTIAPPYASTSRVERIAEDLADLRRELTLAIANGGEEIKQVNNRLDRNEGLISDLIERGARLTDFVNGKTTHTPNYPANDPEPPVDTSWHPFNFSVDLRPDDGKRVVVLTRADHINGPLSADAFDWGECEASTIVAWRYAKEGE